MNQTPRTKGDPVKKNNPNVCPGCSRHCTADSVRCKRGQRYFAGLRAAEAPSVLKVKKHKWEQYVADDSPLRPLLLTGRSVKKALRDEVPEEQLLQALTIEERAQLKELLNKIGSTLENFR